MDWKLLENETGKSLFKEIDWEDSFIREICVVSPSYLLPDGDYVVAPNGLPSARVFISTTSKETQGLELLFSEVENFSVRFPRVLNPYLNIRNNGLQFKFSMDSEEINCRSLYFRMLDESSWGKVLRYSWEDLYDEGGIFVLPE